MLTAIFNLRFALITWPAILIVVAAVLMAIFPAQDWWLVPAAGLCLASVLVGLHDLRQTRHAVLRNYPVAAHLRFLLESIRPEMRQYFFEGDKDGSLSRATSAPSSTSAPSASWTSAPSAPSSTCTRNNMNGCTTPSRRNPSCRTMICA